MDCTSNCKFKPHGCYLTSAFSSEPIEKLKQIVLQRCSNPFKNSDENGRNILHMAASCGRIDVLEWLFNENKLGNVLSMKDKESGWTALHRAVFYGNLDCAVFLYKLFVSETCQSNQNKPSVVLLISPKFMYNNAVYKDMGIACTTRILDWSSADIENNTPLDLIHSDSPRTKKKSKGKKKLAVAILPFESGEAGELTLDVGVVLEILNVNRSGWGVGRLQHNGHKGLFPVNFVEEMKEDVSKENSELFHSQNDVYMWGNNVNLTLGLGNTKNHTYPELAESLFKQRVSLEQVEVTKFHTVFLSSKGEVFTCGHGMRGRLGHSSEETLMFPKKVEALAASICISISAAMHHTLVLDQLGQVFSFGSNDFHQLGHIPPPKQCLLPVAISHKFLRGKQVIGIGTGPFHSLIYTRHELYTFGLNGGQLGYGKGDVLQTIPKLVSQIYKKNTYIKTAVASNGATLCFMENGDMFLLSNYVCRKIVKLLDVKCICMNGGSLDYKGGMEINNTGLLRIVILHESGVVECWKPNYQHVKKCFWLGHKLVNKKIIHISLGKQIIVTCNNGQAYIGYFHRKEDQNITHECVPTPINASKVEVITGNFTLQDVIDKSKQTRQVSEEVHLERIPLLYRCQMCYTDCKGQTFAAIQTDPRNGLMEYPTVRQSTLSEDFVTLLNEATIHDQIHDAYIQVKSTKIPVHWFILHCRLKTDHSWKARLKNEDGRTIIDFSGDLDVSLDDIRRWITIVYTGTKEYVHSPDSVRFNKTEDAGDFSEDDLAFALKMQQFSLTDLESPIEDHATLFRDDDVVNKGRKNRNKKSTYKQTKTERQEPTQRKSNKKRKESHKVCTLDGWNNYLDESDITIESEDGKFIHCHKCVLVARLEYFSNMLNSEWMESSLCRDGIIKMPIPENILNVVINYLYTDKAVSLQGADMNFIGEVLACADQLLIYRLKEICESYLAEKVSLKNAVDLFQFSCTFNVGQLKNFICQFISLNLTYYLEARLLEDLTHEELAVLSNVYRTMVAGMEDRKIKPSVMHIEMEKKEKLLRDAVLSQLKEIKERRKKSSVSDNTSNDTKNTVNNPLVDVPINNTILSKETKESKNGKDKKSLNIHSKGNPWAVANKPSINSEIMTREDASFKSSSRKSPFKKKSQKDRKSGQKFMEDKIKPDLERQTSTGPAWNSLPCESVAHSPPQSFRDILDEQSPQQIKLMKGVKKGAFPRNSANQRRQSSESYDEKSVEKNPWYKNDTEMSVSSEQHQDTFSTIIDVQLEEKREQLHRAKKPIATIQLEERAMEELQKYYESKSRNAELITVNRVKTSRDDTPFWDRVTVD